MNYLDANEQKTTAAERHWIMKGTAKLIQAIQFRDNLASEWKPGNVLHWRKGCASSYTHTQKQKAMYSFKIDKDQI